MLIRKEHIVYHHAIGAQFGESIINIDKTLADNEPLPESNIGKTVIIKSYEEGETLYGPVNGHDDKQYVSVHTHESTNYFVNRIPAKIILYKPQK